MVLGICAANGFFYPEVQEDGWQVNLTAIKSSLLVPSGKVIKDFGKVVTDCQPQDANVQWMGERFCAGADFALPKYHMKVSMCDWNELVPIVGGGSTTPTYSNPPTRARLEPPGAASSSAPSPAAVESRWGSPSTAISALACVALGAALTLVAEHVIGPRVRGAHRQPVLM